MSDPNDPRLPWEDVLEVVPLPLPPDSPFERAAAALRDRAEDAMAQRVKELLKPGAPPVYSYTTGGASTVTGPVDVAGLLALMRPLQQQKDETDRRLVAGLKDVIRQSGRSADEWADRLEIDRGKFARVLAGAEPPGWWFWEAVRAYFEPLRATSSTPVSPPAPAEPPTGRR